MPPHSPVRNPTLFDSESNAPPRSPAEKRLRAPPALTLARGPQFRLEIRPTISGRGFDASPAGERVASLHPPRRRSFRASAVSPPNSPCWGEGWGVRVCGRPVESPPRRRSFRGSGAVPSNSPWWGEVWRVRVCGRPPRRHSCLGTAASSRDFHCCLSQQRFHFCLETFHSRCVSRWAALFEILNGGPEEKGTPGNRGKGLWCNGGGVRG